MSIKKTTQLTYKNLCEERGYDFIECFKKNTNFIKLKCKNCNEIYIKGASNLKKTNSKCMNCVKNTYKQCALDNNFEYNSHRTEATTYVNVKCKECNSCQEVVLCNFMNKSYLCNNCQKKQFTCGYIYKLKINHIHNRFFYIGITDTTLKLRYSSHVRACFNTRKKSYNSKKYQIIRHELRRIIGKRPTKEDFKKYVKMTLVTTINTSRKDLKKLESKLINLNNPDCINSCL